MPLTADNAALLKNIASEKDADDAINKHTIDIDIGLKAQLYDAKIKTIEQKGQLASSEGLLASTIILSYYAELGANSESKNLVSRVVASLRANSQNGGTDSAEDPLSRLTSIVEFENQIQQDGPIQYVQLVRLAKEQVAKSMILDGALGRLAHGASAGNVISRSISDAKLFAQYVAPHVVIDGVFADFLPWLVDETNGARIHALAKIDLSEVLRGLGEVASLGGSNALARQFDAMSQSMGVSPGDESMNDVCGLLRSTAGRSVPASDDLDQITRIRDSLRSLPCRGASPVPGPHGRRPPGPRRNNACARRLFRKRRLRNHSL